MKTMKKLFIVVCLEMLVFGCSPIHKCNSNTNDVSMDEGQIHKLQVRNFSEIPKDLLENLDKMGIDSLLFLTESEGKYFNSLYQIPEKEFNLSCKKVAFFTGSLGKTESNKANYFIIERDRLKCNYFPSIGTLYIFNAQQKAESGGYDAAIVYWSKKSLTIEEVVKRLKKKH